jgi:hypothetical protein
MIEFEQFKTSVNNLKQRLDDYSKSSFLKKLFTRDKVDTAFITIKCKSFVSESLLTELTRLNNPRTVSECFRLLDTFEDYLSLKEKTGLKKKLLQTIINVESFSTEEKKSYQNLTKILAISELKLKNQEEFIRVLNGGSIPE